MKIVTLLLILWSFVFYSVSVGAKDTNQDSQALFDSCQALAVSPKHSEASACRYYIQGFIAGMRVTDTVNTKPHSEVDSQWSSFMERAYRTRVSNKGNPTHPIRLNYFCLPNDEPLEPMLKALSKPILSIANSEQSVTVLEEKFFHKLQEKYPCTQ